MSEPTPYVLGSDDPEIARLDGQASSIAGTTDGLLRAAGIGGPMRVLDLRTGLGHVAFLVADLLGPGGSVLGVDQAERLLEIAERRRAAAGAENIEFLHADARAFTASEPFDAIVERLLLFHLPDCHEVLRRQLDALRPGGTRCWSSSTSAPCARSRKLRSSKPCAAGSRRRSGRRGRIRATERISKPCLKQGRACASRSQKSGP